MNEAQKPSQEENQKRKVSVQGGYRQPIQSSAPNQQPSDTDGLASRATDAEGSTIKDSGYSDAGETSRYQTPDDYRSSTDYDSSTTFERQKQMQRPMLGQRNQDDSSSEGPSARGGSNDQSQVGFLKTIIDDETFDEDRKRLFNDLRNIPMDEMSDEDRERLFNDLRNIPMDDMSDEDRKRLFNDCRNIPMDDEGDEDRKRPFSDGKGMPLDNETQDPYLRMPDLPEEPERLFNNARGIPMDFPDEAEATKMSQHVNEMKYPNIYRNGIPEEEMSHESDRYASGRMPVRQRPNLISPEYVEGLDRYDLLALVYIFILLYCFVKLYNFYQY